VLYLEEQAGRDEWLRSTVAEGVRRVVNQPGRDLLPGKGRPPSPVRGSIRRRAYSPRGSARGGVHPEGERGREQPVFAGGRVFQVTVADLSEYGVPYLEAD
jgi:hypothetical protein